MYHFGGLGMSCPGDPDCPGYVAPAPDYSSILAQQNVCTCQNGVCLENGNSCGPVTSASQSLAQQQAALSLQSQVDPSTLPGFLNKYGPYLALGFGGLLLVAVAGKR